MKSPLRFLIVPAIILFAGLAWMFRTEDQKPNGIDESAYGNSRSMQRAEHRPSQRPIDRLRLLLETPLAHAPSFETVERWATKLSDDELLELVKETGMNEHKGLKGWLRCALFAEWGRRDPEAACEHLLGQSFGPRNYAVGQSWFSVFRGWASKDPDAALKGLGEFKTAVTSGKNGKPNFDLENHAFRFSLRAIFTELAARDPERAWRIAEERRDGAGLRDPAAMEGIFRGASDSKALTVLLDRWTKQIWKDEATMASLATYARQLEYPSTGWVTVPPEALIVRSVASAFSVADIDQGLDWLDTLGNSASGIISHRYQFFRDWSSAHPEDALSLLQLDPAREQAATLAVGLLSTDPSLGPQVMSLVQDEETRSELARGFFTTLSSDHLSDFFPAPGQRNPLRDFEAIYRQVIETVAAAKLRPDEHAWLLDQINREFASRVPAAAEAVKQLPQP